MTGNRIKLLITNDSLPLGGTETLLLQHLEYLDRHFFDVHLITQTDKGELVSDARERADHYACLDRRVGLDIHSIFRLRRYVIEQGIDIIHTNQWIDSLYVLVATKGLPVKRVASIHGYDGTWRHHVNMRVLKHFDRVICVSRSLKLDLYKMGVPWDKLVVLYNCFDANRFGRRWNFKTDKARSPFRMVMVANFRWWKDQKTLIEAVRILKTRGYNIELNLVGKGDIEPFEACQRRVKELNLEEVVKFWGVKRVDGAFLSQFDLFVFSSLCDTFGIALLEAMASSLPVVVSDIPASMELIQHGECGVYFEMGNPRSCADAIGKLIEDRNLCKSMAKKAYLRAQHFRPEKVTKDLESLYFGVLGVFPGK